VHGSIRLLWGLAVVVAVALTLGFDRPFELSLTPIVMLGLCALLADGLRRRASAPASPEARQ
jgi:hypothetical protein